MNSGEWITWFLIASVLIVFPAWEFIQLYRRRKGNKSARTASQFVIFMAESSSGWRWFAILFPTLILLVGFWLIFHWYSLCFALDWFCEVDV